MSYLGNEETLVELPAIEYLEKKLGYNFIHGKELTPVSGARDSLADVVLVEPQLRSSYEKIKVLGNGKPVILISDDDFKNFNAQKIFEMAYDAVENTL